MIEKQGEDFYSAYCDGPSCAESEENDGDFYDMVDHLKAAGWKIFKDENDEWTHLCPSCRVFGDFQ